MANISEVPEKPKGEPRLVEVKVAARYGRFSPAKAYQLIAAGKIEARKDGRKTLIDLNTIDAYHRSLPRMFAGQRGAH